MMKRSPIGHLSRIFTRAGVVVLVCALVWWWQTFGVRMDHIKCLVVSDGVCRLSALGKLFGGSPYSPVLFWIGIACLVAGIATKK